VRSSGLQAPLSTNRIFVHPLLLFLDCSETFESRKGGRERERMKSVDGEAMNATFIGGGNIVPALKVPRLCPLVLVKGGSMETDCSVIRQQRKEDELSLLSQTEILIFDAAQAALGRN
jgi:hypothetical protein